MIRIYLRIQNPVASLKIIYWPWSKCQIYPQNHKFHQWQKKIADNNGYTNNDSTRPLWRHFKCVLGDSAYRVRLLNIITMKLNTLIVGLFLQKNEFVRGKLALFLKTRKILSKSDLWRSTMILYKSADTRVCLLNKVNQKEKMFLSKLLTD